MLENYLETMRDTLIELGISEDVIDTVVAINGYNSDTFESILFVKCGFRSFDQLDEM